ncbi:MAG: methionyl-tRNA formyltransferase [Calditrichaeota bacterium]|nr:MAG: methionyl-tRNA formyltransferase [Calditrichota bacterium]
MGTPEFALPTLQNIHHSAHTIVGIVTQPDRPRGRGQKLSPPPVKRYAIEQGLSPVLQPEKLKDPEFVTQLQALEADVFVVVAFRILPEVVFTMPPKGTVNLHPSLLPKYRGAAPIHWAIINGEQTTGVTTIFIRKEIDAGNILLQREVPIHPDDTAGTLHDRLAQIGADLVVETLDALEAGTLSPRPQDESLATPAPKLTREICHIRFDQPARRVRQWIQGLSPIPGGFAYLEGKLLKFYRARVISEEPQSAPPGSVIKAEGADLWIACHPGLVAVTEVQLEGRKRLSTEAFLRGHPVSVGTILR